jgi:ABC-2 type transport system permease protein
LGYVLYRLNFAFSVGQAFIYILLLINALIFIFSVVLIIATLSFWTTQSRGLAKIFDNLFKIGRYPLDIFGDFWKVVFIYFLPLVLIAQLPSQALLQTLSIRSVFLAISMTTILLIIALKFWKSGLRSYSSAST